MSISDAIYRPFETLIRPLDIPYRPLPTKGPVAVLLHFIAMFRGVIIAMAASSMAIEAINLTIIWGLSVIVDGVTTQGVELFVDSKFGLLAVLAFLLFPVMPILFYITNILNSHTIGISLPVAIQWQGHKAVERQDLAFFHDLFTGQVASRLGQVANAVQQQIVIAFQTAPRFLLQIIGSVVLLLALSWQLALPVVVWVAFNVLFTIKVVPDFTERARRSAKQNSLISGALTDIYGNIQMVKQFAAEDSEAGALRKTMSKGVDTLHHEQRIYRTTELVVISLNMVLWLVMLSIGFWGLFDRFLTVGDFVATVYILQRLSAGSFTFLQMGQQIFRALGTIKDAMPVMTTPPTITDRPDATELTVSRGEICFENVRFAYTSGKPVIDDLSLTVRAGEKVGLVGLSGAGKTTLVSLLLRFYDIADGAILIDGQDIRTVTQASLRRAIGVIAQDVALLHRSVGDNIRYGRPEATTDEIERVAKMASADAFIADLSDGEGRRGYDAFVGDRGIKLSGGQRQRVAIARVLLKDAPILVLDEATSALDSESEAAIQERLNLVMEGKTVIAIAHRLSTIARMDRIVVLDHGRIVEEGRPDELVERDGLFARLWKRQTDGFIPEEIDEPLPASPAA
ncbi:ATP-binding cassette subfamily B protein/ATP-binding cassette subfamily B multidrug efflux pump [Rhizobium sp. BK591]|uniref:ABC transporter ATP-binding protein n=1 Tax=unclassified Rhizobium TaxID=2613769 RepID=UPI0016128F9F|nr:MULTISPECIES: ABC transporter ATP-binding protein [unclassified Rhizobium]MBB3297181.1 ATP-binding cassette subfamily B protein/ATP-binding cassette subfamily B multidrug efflux pump [Rhizobium sp. BK112]MBB3366396.1 ATP-binding cassette subfamily B protein/ATP-binding cassette subfamily B multidrug efflux pump [Rhizobium sp. BK077]MBB3741372.1 ATP-binding cassette subfamily B protein/ATP-binding cassette subfamily B multidrug efflux pump [Rhizobium sp. BK591]MBB4177074.1 ATP-binding cassett